MKILPTIIVLAAGVLAALWWAFMPARIEPPTTAPATAAISAGSAKQCPPGSKADGKLCVCDAGSKWTGRECAVSTDDLQQPDTRHVTTVDLRGR